MGSDDLPCAGAPAPCLPGADPRGADACQGRRRAHLPRASRPGVTAGRELEGTPVPSSTPQPTYGYAAVTGRPRRRVERRPDTRITIARPCRPPHELEWDSTCRERSYRLTRPAAGSRRGPVPVVPPVPVSRRSGQPPFTAPKRTGQGRRHRCKHRPRIVSATATPSSPSRRGGLPGRVSRRTPPPGRRWWREAGPLMGPGLIMCGGHRSGRDAPWPLRDITPDGVIVIRPGGVAGRRASDPCP
jgi:hypothetical protein